MSGIFNNKIFVINQDNRLLCFNIENGTKIWDVRTIVSFIKSQKILPLAVSKNGDLVALNSSGDLLKVYANEGRVDWALSTLESTLAHDSDFFESSKIVIVDENIFFSSKSNFFSYNLNTGAINWKQQVSSVGMPIIDRKNIFFVTENGYFLIISLDTGEIISSTNILAILKKRKQFTKITGFIMGSGKIYSVTLNGYLIVSSASSGKVENFKKIGTPITSAPIINNGKLFIYTENSRILGFD